MSDSRERRLVQPALDVCGMEYHQIWSSMRALARARYSPDAAACAIRRLVLALARDGIELDGELAKIVLAHPGLDAGIRATKAAHDIRQHIGWVRKHCSSTLSAEGGEDERPDN